MLLLHLSDIHFRHDVAGTTMDPDRFLRSEILHDVERMSGELGPVDAILISGDIAYCGHPKEYEFALEWLEELCSRCGCEMQRIFTCPGNHDVDRQKAGGVLIRSLRSEIRAAGDLHYRDLLRQMLTDSESGQILYAPLADYNAFASRFFCGVLPPDQTYASRDLTLNDGSTLRLVGFNSALLSSADDAPRLLYVDPACYQLERLRGVEYLTLCHHPFEWLRDGAALRDHINEVAKIQLFGHDHTERILLTRHFVRVSAGAMHPNRKELGWEPGYNLLDIQVQGTGAHRELTITVHVRQYQTSPSLFRPMLDRGGESFFHSTIRLDPWTAPPGVEVSGDNVVSMPLPTAPVDRNGHGPARSDPMNTLRDISIRFFKLTLSQKSAIAGKLELLEEEDANLPDFERFRRVLLRARDRNLLEALENELDAIIQRRAAE